MAETTLVVNHEAGLHARPLAAFVKVARRYEASIEVSNETSGKGPADGKSPVGLLLLSVLMGNKIRVVAEGPDAESALEELTALVEGNFASPDEGAS
jgi:phosphotransferase system HPr (HPr) family protein